MNVALWVLTHCFINRNLNVVNSGDNILQIVIFMLMFAPTGQAFSLDARRRRRAGTLPEPNMTPAWPVRVLQIQLVLIYCTTGLVKLKGEGGWFTETWWEGTSVHYVLTNTVMTRFPYPWLPLPFWMTMVMTYTCVFWEALFPFLIFSRWTRKWALWFGVLFHLGILASVEIGWFSFYSLMLYAVWVPGEFWDRWRRKETPPPPGVMERTAA